MLAHFQRGVAEFLERPYWIRVRARAWENTRRWLKDHLGAEILVAGVPGLAAWAVQYEVGAATVNTAGWTLAASFGSWFLTGLVVFVYYYNCAPAELARAATGKIANENDSLSPKATQLLEAVPLRGEIRMQQTATWGTVVAIIDSRDGPVVVGNWSFFADDKSSELGEQYHAALKELIQKEYARDAEGKGEAYRLTARGWQVTKQLAIKELAEIRTLAADLTKDERALLEILDIHQQAHAPATKLIVDRYGNTVRQDDTGAGLGYTSNLFEELKIAIRNPHFALPQFDTLMEQLPMPYLERIPEFRVDNPFLVRVTRVGRRYLRALELIEHTPDGQVWGTH